MHFVAGDEKRANFALNSIKPSDGDAPPNVREIVLPGAHSDIGGGYHQLQEEKLLLHPILTIRDSYTDWPDKSWQWEQLESLRRQIADEQWIGDYSVELKSGKSPALWIDQRRDVHPPPYGRVDLSLKMHRLVHGEYSGVIRELMHRLASQSGVPLRPLEGPDKIEHPDDLEAIRDRLLDQILEGVNEPSLRPEDMRLVRQRYIHHSDHYNLLQFLAFGLVTKLEVPFRLIQPFKTAEGRERKIYWNNQD